MANEYSDDSFTFPSGREDESYVMGGAGGSHNLGKSHDQERGGFYTESRNVQMGAAPGPRRKIAMDVVIRLLTCASCAAGLVVMVLDKQTIPGYTNVNNTVVPVTFRANWNYASAFVWFVIATGLVACYALTSAGLTLISTSRKPGSSPRVFMWAIFIFDLLMMNILMSALGASIATGVIGRYGNTHTGWQKVCNNFDRFCDHLTGALVAGGAGLVFLIQLCVLDAYHLSIQGPRVSPTFNSFP